MFTRSWPLHAAKYAAAMHRADLANGAVPLCFLGKTRLGSQHIDCDLWLGPTGDTVYHLHPPFSTDYVTVGIPHWIDRSKIDLGIVLVYIRASNPEWHGLIQRSINDEFEDIPIYWMNARGLDGNPVILSRHGEMPEKYKSLVQALNKRGFVEGNSSYDLEYAHDIHCGHRFLVKLALGMGSIFLDPSFVTSSDADLLRTCLWNRSSPTWPDGLLGSPFFSPMNKTFDRLTDWKGCHLVMMHEHEGGVALMVKLYGKYGGSFKVSSMPCGFERHGSPQMIWMVSPGLRLYEGPLSLDEYTDAFLYPSDTDRLCFLRKTIDSAPELPDFDLPQNVIASLPESTSEPFEKQDKQV